MGAKTLLFCTSFFANQDAWTIRYQRWLDHHLALCWNIDAVAMIDDGSPFQPQPGALEVIEADSLGKQDLPCRSLIRFKDNLGRQSTLRYPGWWRSFQLALDIAEIYQFDKVVHVESDTYLLSTRMLDVIEKTDKGWTLFWSSHFQWPETALQIVCRDAFDAYARIREKGPYGLADQAAEDVLPYSRIEKALIGDRYSDFGAQLPVDADYAVQVTSSMPTLVPSSWPRRLRYRPLARRTTAFSAVASGPYEEGPHPDAKALKDRAIMAYQRGDFATAIPGLEIAVGLLPTDPDSRKFLAASLMQVGRGEDAIKQGEQAALLAPSDAGLANMLGAFYASLGNGGAALDHWRRAIHLDPSDATPLLNMQSVEARLQMPSTASAAERQFMVDWLIREITSGNFSRTRLVTLLDLWDLSSASPKDMRAVLAVARASLMQVVGKEVRGLSRLACMAGNVELAIFYTEPLAQAAHAGEGDRLCLAELNIAKGTGDWRLAWQLANRARRALYPARYLATDDSDPLSKTDALLVYQDGDAVETLIGLRFVERLVARGVRVLLWLNPETRAVIGDVHTGLLISDSPTLPEPRIERGERSISVFGLCALSLGTVADMDQVRLKTARSVTGIGRVQVTRFNVDGQGTAAAMYRRLIETLTQHKRTLVEFSPQPFTPAPQWLTSDHLITDDIVTASVAARAGDAVWLVASPAIDWRLRIEKAGTWWPNLKVLQPSDDHELDTMAADLEKTIWGVQSGAS